MTVLAVLEAASDTLSTALPTVDVLVGEVPTTPTRPYIVLTSTLPSVTRAVSGRVHRERVTLLVMSVSDSYRGCLWLAQRVRQALEGVRQGSATLRYDFASAPIEDDHPGDYRWSITADFVIQNPKETP